MSSPLPIRAHQNIQNVITPSTRLRRLIDLQNFTEQINEIDRIEGWNLVVILDFWALGHEEGVHAGQLIVEAVYSVRAVRGD
jgi:hypothetical protein